MKKNILLLDPNPDIEIGSTSESTNWFVFVKECSKCIKRNTLRSLAVLMLILFSNQLFAQQFGGARTAMAVNYQQKNPIKKEYQRFVLEDKTIYKETAYSVTPSAVPAAGAATPCTAHRWVDGDGWRGTGSVPNVAWTPTVTPQPSDQPKGIVRCASSAETESGLEVFKGTYVVADNPIAAVLPKTDCFSMTTETFGNSLSAPTPGEEIVWMNFDIRPLAGTYQFQIVTNQNVGFVLFYVDPDSAQPGANTAGTTYPSTVSGDCTKLVFSTIDIGGVSHPACGFSGNGWTTITVPSFKKPTNYYLAMWMADPGVTAFPNNMNLVYKSRFGCGGATCTLQHLQTDVACSGNNAYTACLTYGGSAGRWFFADATAGGLATSVTCELFDQFMHSKGTSTSPFTLGTISDSDDPNNPANNQAVFAKICATYPIGTGYDISVTPDATYKPSNDYITCADGDRRSGASPTLPSLTLDDPDPFCDSASNLNLHNFVTSQVLAGQTLSFYTNANPNVLIPDATASNYSVTQTTIIVVRLTNNTTGCFDSKLLTITVNSKPTVVANDAPVCTGSTVQLTGTPAGGTWSGAHVSASGLFDAAGLAAGTYNVTYTYTDANQCSNSDGAVVTVNALPTVVANDAPVCTGSTVQLTATPAGGTWSGAHVSASGLFDAAGLAAGTYNVTYTYTNANNCTNSDGAVVTVNALPTVVANDAPVCTGSTVQLTATPAGGTWSGAHVNASGLFDAAGLAPGTYNVTYTYTDGNTCTNSDGAVVTVNALPTVVANDAPVCTGSTVQLTATPAGGTWSGAHVSASGLFDAAGLAPGTYNVTYTYTDGNTCTNSDGAVVTVNALPTVVANDAPVCTGSTVQLTGTPAGGTWSGAHISASGLFDAAGLAAGTYNVTYTYTNANNCTNSDGAVVTVNALPIVVANDAPVCTGSTVQLTATPAGGTWSGAHISASGLFDAAGLAAGTYNVTYTYTNANQCTNSDGAVVTVNALPTVVANDSPVCTGSTVQLTATPVGGTWSGAHVSASGLFDAAGLAAGTYNVTYTYTDGNTCTNSDGAVVTVTNLPTVVANDAPVCTGSTVQLTATPVGGTWSGAHVSASGLFDAAGLAAGTYNVTYTYTNGSQCTNSDGAVVTVNALPTVVANDAPVCTGSTVQLTATPAGGTWSGAHVSASGLFDAAGLAAGTYNVTYTYTDGNTCTNSDGAVVTVNALPVCPTFSDSLLNEVDCGVSASVAQNGPDDPNTPNFIEGTNPKFAAWFNGFQPPAGSSVTNVTYAYTPAGADQNPSDLPNVSNAPLNPILGVPGSTETSVLVTWTIQSTAGCTTTCSARFTVTYNCSPGCDNTVANVLCKGASTGSIRVTAQGGTPPYSVNLYKVGDPVSPYRTAGPLNTGSIDQLFDNLPAGTYNYTVTDATNATCNNNEAIVITEPTDALDLVSLTPGSAGCNQSNGTILAVISGGTPPYTIKLDNGTAVSPNGAGGTSHTFTGVAAGPHTVTVYDANYATSPLAGCTDSGNTTIESLPCGGHIFPTQTACCNIVAGNATELHNVCYSAKKAGTVSNAIPGVFFYYTRITAPAANFTLNVVQTKSCSTFKYFAVQGGKDIKLFGPNCTRLNTVVVSEPSTGQARMVVTGATPGTEYVLGVKYEVKSLIGSTYPGVAPTCTYDFVTNETHLVSGAPVTSPVANSSGSIDAVYGCSDNTPLPPACTDGLPLVNNAPSGQNTVEMFSAYPVPFKDYVNIRYEFNYHSKARIEIYDAKGMFVKAYDDADAYFNKEVRLDVDFNQGDGQMYIIKVITDNEVGTKRIISKK